MFSQYPRAVKLKSQEKQIIWKRTDTNAYHIELKIQVAKKTLKAYYVSNRLDY